MKLNNWKIGKRIAAGFATVIVATVGLGVFAYTQLRFVDNDARHIAEESVPGLYDSAQLRINSLQRYKLLEEYIAASNPADLARLNRRRTG